VRIDNRNSLRFIEEVGELAGGPEWYGSDSAACFSEGRKWSGRVSGREQCDANT
jgi:hypothetical protein